MDEKQVKAAALMHLRKQYIRRRKPLITAEFSLGSSGVRADLVLFAEQTIGFEIKTAKDTLRRLPSQMQAYARYFNEAIVIAAPCHVRNVMDENLHGASVWTYDDNGVLTVLRAGVVNAVDESTLADLLTQAERRKSSYRAAMEGRYAATSRHFWQTVSRRSIRPDDLPLLSRFTEHRAEARRIAKERDTRWSRWLAAQGCLEIA